MADLHVIGSQEKRLSRRQGPVPIDQFRRRDRRASDTNTNKLATLFFRHVVWLIVVLITSHRLTQPTNNDKTNRLVIIDLNLATKLVQKPPNEL